MGSLHISLEGIPEDERLPLASRVLAARDQLASYGNHWERARSALKDTPEAMNGLIEFRRRVVNGLVNELRGPDLPPFDAISVDSTAATSVIDMTLASPGAGTDIEAMKKFNSEIKRLFGKQPGYALDTNIHVQGTSQPRTTLAVKYSEADALFTLCNARLVAKLEETGPVIPAGIGDLSEADRSLLEEQPEAGSTRDILKAQMMQAVKVEKIRQHDPNRLLEARNEVYAEVAYDIRALEIDLVKLESNEATTSAELAAMHAQRMRLTGQAIFFADEVYPPRPRAFGGKGAEGIKKEIPSVVSLK